MASTPQKIATSKRISAITLGCDKNRTDTEKVLYMLSQAGYTLVSDMADADIILVNTCGFIDKAKKESIDAVLTAGSYKPKKLIVMGCMAERYAETMAKEMPEVDAFVGVNGYDKIVEIINAPSKAEARPAEKIFTPKSPCDLGIGRVITTPYHYAYLKIADGCNNRCSYCAIPKIRGPYRSIPQDTLIEEAKALLENGVKELIIVAQDTLKYGQKPLTNPLQTPDKPPINPLQTPCNRPIFALLEALSQLDFATIRLLYAYPEEVDEELLSYISHNPKMAKYLDVPMQHIDDGVLRLMNRRTREADHRRVCSLAKKYGITLRSSFIAGFYGESEDAFNKLLTFIEVGNIDYAGFFAYSKEEDTPASTFKNPVPKAIREKRRLLLEKAQSKVIVENNKKHIGKTYKVIYEGINYDKQMFYGRTDFMCPDVDNIVLFSAKTPIEAGNYYQIRITKTDFNLYGEVVD